MAKSVNPSVGWLVLRWPTWLPSPGVHFPSSIPCFLPFGSLLSSVATDFLRHAHFPFPPTHLYVGGRMPCVISVASYPETLPCAAKPGVICYDPRPPSTFPPFIRFLTPLGLFQG
ncbi:uncharacterized protein AKAW2_40753A [Aspergillus luchuensis]|uniref:Uncharacterized protein n=2 Tax=Aspergillus kawachii TaxID=1069201 RepID=A0A7R7WA16_ASPKA|nr:uncharacterized protein AKAW2_40753A [Aspergillus luchuensis]OJZ84219.1 hypothetical protein ASPFODRAFT_48196 [Aspergillus luchuensis CBS 106.47]BCR99070.1 hypothetical protein AKAW2_40753A [Aspergillus luchuensis]